MEETHQKKIEDLQRQHQRELEKLREEKDRLLAEETAATISGGSWAGGHFHSKGRAGGGLPELTARLCSEQPSRGLLAEVPAWLSNKPLTIPSKEEAAFRSPLRACEPRASTPSYTGGPVPSLASPVGTALGPCKATSACSARAQRCRSSCLVTHVTTEPTRSALSKP